MPSKCCPHLKPTYSYYLQYRHSDWIYWEMLQAEYILDLQKQLSLMGSEARRESNGTLSPEESIPSMTTIDKVCSELSFMHQVTCISRWRQKFVAQYYIFLALKFRLQIPFLDIPLLFPWAVTVIIDNLWFLNIHYCLHSASCNNSLLYVLPPPSCFVWRFSKFFCSILIVILQYQ